MKFLIQINEDKTSLRHDFIFYLENVIEFNNIFNNEKIEKQYSCDVITKENVIPVGTVEFVNKFYLENYGIVLKPLNVPECLFPFAKREIKNLKELRKIDKPYFIKSNEIIKYKYNGFHNSVYDNGIINGFENHSCQISEYIENGFESEWRAFVFNNELLDVKKYCGDFKKYPFIPDVENCVRCFENAPVAYTLDFGICSSRGTVLIEVHNFYSCGLYGFDYNLLPYMYSQLHYQILKRKN